MILTEAEGLRKLGTAIFTALGAEEKRAAFVSGTLVEANLCGHDSHGVFYYATYGDRIKKKFIDPKVDPVIVKETPASAYVDGRWGFGQVTAMKVMETAVEKARKSMVAAVGAYNVNHIGRLGYYTTWATTQGMVGMLFANVGNPLVSGFHGTGRTFGTNPVSISTPTATGENFLMDYATSLAAAGKISVARAKHAKIPIHWVRDKNGKQTDDPNAFYDGGYLLGFGEHKGYGLQMAAELLGAVLTGSRTSMDNSQNPPSPNGVFCVAINPEAFVGLEPFKTRSSEVIKIVKSRVPEPGETVLVPGDPERIAKASRLRDGIQLPEDSWDAITRLAAELGIDPSIALKRWSDKAR
jgi:LDH2 family malate/lactate/ureidoglycolate dehydrogenase